MSIIAPTKAFRSYQLPLHLDGQLHELNAGDFVYIPKGTPHAQGNRGQEPVHLLLSVAPAVFVGFFRAREELVKTSPPGTPNYGPRMEALSDTFDVENLAPAPC